MISSLRARRRLAELAPDRRALLDRMLDRTPLGPHLRHQLLAADLKRTPAAFVRLSFAAGLGGAALLMVWSGALAGIVGFVAGVAAPSITLRRRIASRSERAAAQMPEVIASLAAPVRAGASLPQAFAAAAEEAEPPLADALARTTRDLDNGVPIDQAVERFVARCAIPEAVLIGRALRVARHAGGELARVLDEVTETLRDRERLARELRAATAQGRASAMIVAALPVVFLLLMSAGAGDQAHLLFGEPIGWLLLGVGGGLETAGIFWIRRVTRKVDA